MNSNSAIQKSTLRSAVLLAMSVGTVALSLNTNTAYAAQNACYSAVSTTGGNFTMLQPDGSGGDVVGGTNDVTFTWDGTVFTSNSDYTGPGGASNATLASSTPFNGVPWFAHTVQIFGPGTYTFASGAGDLTMTVSQGQLGAHMLFDWGPSTNIDVVVVWGQGAAFSNCESNAQFGAEGTSNCLYTGPTNTAGNTVSTVWDLVSTDDDGDGTLGVPMVPNDGPFASYNANFNVMGPVTLLPGANPCVPVADTDPDQFTFTDVTGAAVSTSFEANAVFPGQSTTVSGLGAGVSAPITVTGGQYSLDGGVTYTSTDGTVQNGNTVRVRQTSAANEDGTTTNAILTIGTISDTFSVTTVDKRPNPFNFQDNISAATGTMVESDTITISGLGAASPINIAGNGGEYSINGGIYTSAAGTILNNQTVRVRQTSSSSGATTTNTTLTIGGVSDTFSVTTVGGNSSTGNNFTMINPAGGKTGGTNDVAFTWDGQCDSSASSTNFSRMTLGSFTPFNGYQWTAHHIRVFCPGGPYTINVDCTTAQLEAGTCAPNTDPAKNYVFTVGQNQVGAHMLFNWNITTDIDVINIWTRSAAFSPSPMHTAGQGFNADTTVWDLMSMDWDNDSKNGSEMIDGAFPRFSANFNLKFSGTASNTDYTPTVNVEEPSNSPGCSVTGRPVHPLERGDWWLVAGFIAWLAMWRRRVRRQALLTMQ